MEEIITNDLQFYLKERSLEMKDLIQYLTEKHNLKHNDMVAYEGSTLKIVRRNMEKREWFLFEKRDEVYL